VAQTHTCPHCHSANTVPTLKEPTRQYYLCRDCRSAYGVPSRPDAPGDTADAPQPKRSRQVIARLNATGRIERS
jgi:transposase-like protein